MSVTVVAGAARSGKTSRLRCAYRQRLATGPLGGTLWLAPTHRAAADVAARLVADGLVGSFQPNLLTFDQLAARVLAAAPLRMRPISPAMVRSTLKRVVDHARSEQRLTYFSPIAHTPGFLDLLVAYVREMKRLEIWPEELAAAFGRRATAKDRELCELYRQYQQLLTAHDLYDRQGQCWAARRLLRDGHSGPFDAVRHVFVDGFTDFTRTEQDVLEVLARRAESLVVSLAYEPDSPRTDLFVKTARTLDELRRRHPTLTVECVAPRTHSVAALGHLERHLFDVPGRAEPLADARGIEIVAAAGVTHEVELLAERVKGLLVGAAGAPPVPAADVLVVFRSLTDVAPLVREVFEQYGIPCVVAAAPRLASAPPVQAVLAWLRLDVDDWPFRQVLAAIGHNLFRPAWPEWHAGRAAAALEGVVRDLELPSGRRALVAGAGRLARAARDALSEKRRVSRRLLAAEMAAPLLERVCEALDRLPQQATPGEWARALAAFVDELGLLAASASDADADAGAATEAREAWQRLLAALVEEERVAHWIGAPAGVLSRREFLAALEDLAASEEMPLARDESGCVRVLSAESARNLSVPYVFVAGLSEKAFPPAAREDCLTSDADARRLIKAGLPLTSHALRSRYEMLLFYEVVSRATRQLVLSYPALDSAAQPLVASPYLSEVEQACGAGRVRRNAQPHLSSVPASDDVRSVRDLRVRGVDRALAGDTALLADFCGLPGRGQTAANIIAGLRTNESRFRGDGYGPFEGMLAAPAAARKLAEQFGPKRCWSPSQLEQYAYCPFQFFLERVLKVEPTGAPELAVDYMERGRLLHWVLSRAHRTWNERGGGPRSPLADAAAEFGRITAELLDELRALSAGDAVAGGLAELNLRKLTRWIEAYVRQHAEYDTHWTDWQTPARPSHFEVAFGPRHRDDPAAEADALPDDSDPLSSLEPLEIACGDETILFAGRIDRIDLGRLAGEVVFTIVDYKSGSGSSKTSLQAVLEGRSLQPWVYALAAEKLLAERRAAPFRAAYWHIAGDGYQEGQAIKFRELADGRLEVADEWRTVEDTLKHRVRALVTGIRHGEFPMHCDDDKCTGNCAFSTVCRVNQARSVEKQWRPPGEDVP